MRKFGLDATRLKELQPLVERQNRSDDRLAHETALAVFLLATGNDQDELVGMLRRLHEDDDFRTSLRHALSDMGDAIARMAELDPGTYRAMLEGGSTGGGEHAEGQSSTSLDASLVAVDGAQLSDKADGVAQLPLPNPAPDSQTALPTDGRPLPPARHSTDFRSVHWFGTDYTFTEAQALVVAILWQEWENGTPEVGHRTLLQGAKLDADRLPDVFKEKGRYHPAWGTMIRSNIGSKGSARLCPPGD